MQQGRLHSFLGIAIAVVAVLMVVYHLLGVFIQPLDAFYHANTHLLFVSLMVLLFALRSATSTGWKIEISLALMLTLISVGYMYANAERLQYLSRLTTTDLIIGIGMIVLIFELVRRAIGIGLPLIGLLFLAYAIWGHYAPAPFEHLPVSLNKFVRWTGMSATQGIYGRLIFISANIIFMFIMFGVMLEITKARDFFNQVGLAMGRLVVGGTAMAAMVASGLVGMITGSPVANTIITGVVTIPMMKKAGFKSQVAAAVEATASSGGLFMPPVMGALAFIMMSLTGLSYLAIIIAATIPALLYYLNIGFSVFFHAGRQSIPKSEEAVDVKLLLRRAPLFIIPFGLITTLIVFKYPVMYAAGWALLVGLVLGFISKETRPSLKELLDAIIRGTRTASEIATMVIFCNMAFIAVLSLTSMAPKLGILISMLGGGVVLGVLVITMFVSLILGMVTPGTGAYMIVALLTVPGLTAMGLSVTQAHFFAIFMATLGFFTPPVAPAAIVTSRIAGVPYFGTCWESLKLATGAFLLPFIFVFDSSLLGDFSSGLLSAGSSIGLAILVMIVTPIVVQRYYLTKLSWPEIVLGVASLVALLIYFMGGHNILVAVVGVALFVLLTLSQVIKRRARTPKHMPVSASW